MLACSNKSSKNNEDKGSKDNDSEKVSTIALTGNRIDSVAILKDVVFESNEEVFIEGYINGFDLDSKERVYIAASMAGTLGIYVFDPEGNYITRFVEEGRGPGEYESISSIDIWKNKLIIFDTRLQKIGVFSLVDFSHVKDISIDYSLLQKNKQIPVNSKANKVSVMENGDFLIRYRSLPSKGLNQEPKEIYFQLSDNGEILPGSVLELKSFSYYYPDGQFNLPFTMPFSRSSIIAISEDGHFYTSWTGEAQIKIFDSKGNYESAINFKIQDVPINMDKFNLYPNEKRTLSKYKLPETWQKFHTIELDDKGRLWVAMITNSDSTFKWAVINRDKKLMAEFNEIGSQKSYSINSKPNRLIKNEYFYSHEFSLDKGIDRIVKYKIEFIKR